jgi:hypothetical protein
MDDDEAIKPLLEKVLTNSGFADSRSAKMDVDDLLKYAFLDRISSMQLTLFQAAFRISRCSHTFFVISHVLKWLPPS